MNPEPEPQIGDYVAFRIPHQNKGPGRVVKRKNAGWDQRVLVVFPIGNDELQVWCYIPHLRRASLLEVVAWAAHEPG